MNRLVMKREDEHSKVDRLELEICDSTNKDMAGNVLVCNSEQVHLKGGVQHANGVASTNLKGEGTSLDFFYSPVHVTTSTLNVEDITYTCKSDERCHNNWVRFPLPKPQPFCGHSLKFPHWPDAYLLAMTRLKERFGNPSVIANPYYEKLSNWHRITDNDNNALRKYSDFFQQCCVIF